MNLQKYNLGITRWGCAECERACQLNTSGILANQKFKDKEQSPANNFKTKHNKSKNFN
jgi:hypothetical protein